MAPENGATKYTVALWHAGGNPPPQRLVTGLGSRGISTVAVESPFAALAEACLLCGTQTPGARAGSGRGGLGNGVVLVFPERLDGVEAFCDALRRYAPAARLWAYGPVSNPRLAPVVEPEEGHGPPEHGNPGAPADVHQARSNPPSPQVSAAEPKLRLTEAGPVNTGLESADPDGMEASEGGRPRPLLSAEELAMLLGTDDSEGTNG